MDGVIDRRIQVTKGNTTCALSTGQMLQPPPTAIKLNVSEFFRPDIQVPMTLPIKFAREKSISNSLISHCIPNYQD